jgi:polyisoprenoid-binding protein YceI
MSRFFFLALSLLPCAASATLQPLVIDQTQSRVEIAVKATVGSFVGKLANYVTVIAVDSEKRSIEQVAFEFHINDVQTGNATRDKDMLDWEQAAKFPDGRFTLTALDMAAGGRCQARGMLTLHGRSREIVFPATISKDHSLYSIDGDALLDTRDFGLPILHSYWLLTVDPVVHVRFHLKGHLSDH